MTREKAAGMCWMKQESQQRGISLDKRAEIVDKCVSDTLRQFPVGHVPQ